MNLPIEWTITGPPDSPLKMYRACHGPYVAQILPLAIASLSIEHMWQIVDTRNFELVKGGTHKMNGILASLAGAEPEDIINKVKQHVNEELWLLLDMEEVEKLLLGE